MPLIKSSGTQGGNTQGGNTQGGNTQTNNLIVYLNTLSGYILKGLLVKLWSYKN